MKIIDLLKIVADEVNVPPKRIKYNDRIFEYKLWIEPNKYAYVENGKNNTLEEYCCFYDLNDEVEIIKEEKKIPEKINKSYNIRILDLDKPHTIKDYDMEQLIEMVQDIYSKQSEILDYLKSKGE